MIFAPTLSQHATAYLCGPVRLSLNFGEESWHKALNGLLSQYDAPWPEPSADIFIAIERGTPPHDFSKPAGNYLRSYRLHVDRQNSHLVSLSNVGVWMDFDEVEGRAKILVPESSDNETVIEEIEQQLVLLLARVWSNEGWTPLHAGSLIAPRGKNCLFVCAPSGVGKTTLITSMLCRNWGTLGDDKVLLKNENGAIHARALSGRVHLHPSLSDWFPEIGEIAKWPRYSRWTEKRMVKMEMIWPGQLLEGATPAALVQLERATRDEAFEVEPMSFGETLHTLCRQIAIPSDAEVAKPLIASAAALSGQLRAARLFVGNNVFADASNCLRLEKILQELLP